MQLSLGLYALFFGVDGLIFVTRKQVEREVDQYDEDDEEEPLLGSISKKDTFLSLRSLADVSFKGLVNGLGLLAGMQNYTDGFYGALVGSALILLLSLVLSYWDITKIQRYHPLVALAWFWTIYYSIHMDRYEQNFNNAMLLLSGLFFMLERNGLNTLLNVPVLIGIIQKSGFERGGSIIRDYIVCAFYEPYSMKSNTHSR